MNVPYKQQPYGLPGLPTVQSTRVQYTDEEQKYANRLRGAGADEKNVKHYVKRRREEPEKLQKDYEIAKQQTPFAFKQKILSAYPKGRSNDGRSYVEIPAGELMEKILKVYPEGKTSEGIPYKNYAPTSNEGSSQPRISPNNPLTGTPSRFYAGQDSSIRATTKEEDKYADKVIKRKEEGEVKKIAMSPFRAIPQAVETSATGLEFVVLDLLDSFGVKLADKAKEKVKIRTEKKEPFQAQGAPLKRDSVTGGVQGGTPSEVMNFMFGLIPNLMLFANPVGATGGIASVGGNLSLEGEMQGQDSLGDKAIAYTAGTISGLIDRFSGKAFSNALKGTGLTQTQAGGFQTALVNGLRKITPAQIEGGTEVIQEKIENIARDFMGVEYDKDILQYANAYIGGHLASRGMGSNKARDAGGINYIEPQAPKKNTKTLQGINMGEKGNKILKNAQKRGFDPVNDVAQFNEIAPVIDAEGKVNTETAQKNLEEFISPLQDRLTEAIEEQGTYITKDQYRELVMKEIEGEASDVVNIKSWEKKGEKAVETAYEKYGDGKGNISLAGINKIKKKLGSSSNWLDPKNSLYKAISRGSRKAVETYADGIEVEKLNNELARWYTTQEYLVHLGRGTSKVKGGRLGKGMARLGGMTVGAVAGTALGPLGSVVSGLAVGEISSQVAGRLMKKSFKPGKRKLSAPKTFSNLPTKKSNPPEAGKAKPEPEKKLNKSYKEIKKTNNSIKKKEAKARLPIKKSEPVETPVKTKTLTGMKNSKGVVRLPGKSDDVTASIKQAKKYNSAEEFVDDIGLENIIPFSDNYIVIGGSRGLSKRAMQELNFQLGNTTKGDSAYSKVIKEMLETPKEDFIKYGKEQNLKRITAEKTKKKADELIKKEREKKIKMYGKDSENIKSYNGYAEYFRKRGFKVEKTRSNISQSEYLLLEKNGKFYKIRFSDHPYYASDADFEFFLPNITGKFNFKLDDFTKKYVDEYKRELGNPDQYDLFKDVFKHFKISLSKKTKSNSKVRLPGKSDDVTSSIKQAKKEGKSFDDWVKGQTKFGDIKKIDLTNPQEQQYISRFAKEFEKQKSASGLSYATADKMGTLNTALKQKGFKGVSSTDFKGAYSLDKIIDNPKLFEKYPQLKEVNVYFADFHTPTQRGVHINNDIFLNSKLYAKNPTDINSTLVHEIEHAIQDIKGDLPKYSQFEKGRGMTAKEYATDLREEGARMRQQEYLDVIKTRSQLKDLWNKVK